ncbi:MULTISPECIES: hypothetical protein [Bacillaceae]|uniref:hypothetical protein n=1 Tax=Bacillaceae TaxID=186817 RepID=UPI0005AAADC8|nr:hypothetical protein [Bacillus rubiinfantis]
MAVKDEDLAMSSNRAFMEEWCYVWGGYSKEFYRNLSDEELEAIYNQLNNKVRQEQQSVR